MAEIENLGMDSSVAPSLDVSSRLDRIRGAMDVLSKAGTEAPPADTTGESIDSTTKVVRTVAALGAVAEGYEHLQKLGVGSEDEEATRVVTPLSPEQKDLVGQHIELVRHVVFQVSVNFPRHVDRLELEAAGRLGLVDAASRFDPSREIPFDRFAAQRIRGAILDNVRSQDWAPRSVRNLARRVESAEQAFASQHGRNPSDRELAEVLEMATDELTAFRDKHFQGVVLALEYDMNDGDEDLTLVEVLADTREVDPLEALLRNEDMSIVGDAVLLLPERHRHVIVSYFLQRKTSDQIAKELGVTESRVSQLRSEGLERIRDAVEAQYVELDGEESSALPIGRVQRRVARYVADVANQTGWKDRLTVTDLRELG
jgi:RNA polymerase sigma factor for flagellar operon FliA